MGPILPALPAGKPSQRQLLEASHPSTRTPHKRRAQDEQEVVGRRTTGTRPEGIPRKKRISGASTPRRLGSAEYHGSPSSLLRAEAKNPATTTQLVLTDPSRSERMST